MRRPYGRPGSDWTHRYCANDAGALLVADAAVAARFALETASPCAGRAGLRGCRRRAFWLLHTRSRHDRPERPATGAGLAAFSLAGGNARRCGSGGAAAGCATGDDAGIDPRHGHRARTRKGPAAGGRYSGLAALGYTRSGESVFGPLPPQCGAADGNRDLAQSGGPVPACQSALVPGKCAAERKIAAAGATPGLASRSGLPGAHSGVGPVAGRCRSPRPDRSAGPGDSGQSEV